MRSAKQPIFSSSFYDDKYFETMAPGCRRLFRQTCGTKLGDHRMGYFHLSQIEEGMRLLDLGCGAGEFLMYCALKAGTESWGIDYSAAAVRLANELRAMLPADVQERVHMEQGDCTELGQFRDAFFDRIIWFSVIEHLYDWQIRRVLQEAFRILKPDGVFITETHPNRNAGYFGYPLARLILNILSWENKSLKFSSDEGGHINTQSPQGIRRHFARAGFQTRIVLRSNCEFVNHPRWVKTVGHLVRNKAPFRWLFGDEITVIAAKSPLFLQKWEDLIPHFVSQAVG